MFYRNRVTIFIGTCLPVVDLEQWFYKYLSIMFLYYLFLLFFLLWHLKELDYNQIEWNKTEKLI